ncbi:MAG: transposase [Planctomycetia bacterium]|nr:transposase [Planctomycetia bacterium]
MDQEDQQSLKELFRVIRRLHKAYLLKEQFVQLWDYYRPEWARKFLRSVRPRYAGNACLSSRSSRP